MSAEWTNIAPMLVVVATALVVLVADAVRPREDARIPGGISVVGLVAAGVMAFRMWQSLPTGGARLGFPRVAPAAFEGATWGLLRIDAFGLYAVLTLILIAALVSLSAMVLLDRENLPRAEFYVIMLIATASMMMLCVANDLILIFLAIEAFSIALYVLCALRRAERRGLESALKYFVLGAFAGAFQLYGIALLYADTGTTSLAALGVALDAPSTLAWAGIGLLLAGLFFKVALVPFHQWTPDVYDGAPAMVTGFMAAGTKLAAFVALARVLWTAAPGLAEQWQPLLWALAVVTMVVGNLAALMQANIKRMLGYSAVAHAGYILVAVAAGPELGLPAMLFYLLMYAVTNLGVFAVLIAVGPVGDEGREAMMLEDLSGLAARNPWLAGLLTLFLLSLTGLPPTAGFLAKWYVFQAAVDAGLVALAIVLILNSVVSAFYYLRPVGWMLMREPTEGAAKLEIDTGNAVALTVCGALVGLAILLGRPLIDSAQRAQLPATSAAAFEAAEGGGVFLTAPGLDKEGR